jgi:imidazolonepropionase-like amidohydrolase
LRNIVEHHFEHIAMAADLGVDLVAGSDAGSHGVRHGEALIDELEFFSRAGLPMKTVLRSATSLPRTRWGIDAGMIGVGRKAHFITLDGNPFEDVRFLRRVTNVCDGETITPVSGERRERIAVGE